MMRCPTSEKLASYQTEALASREIKLIQAHAANCDACQAELQALERTIQLLERVPTPAPPDNLWAGVADRLPARPRAFVWHQWWKTATGAGVVAGIAIALFVARTATTRLPAAPATTSSYVAENALLSTQDIFADRASVGIMLAAQRGGQ